MKKLIRPLDIILIAVLLLGAVGFHFYTKNTTSNSSLWGWRYSLHIHRREWI